MKKTILAASLLAAIPAYCLPTYEPFTEFTSKVTANPTNAIDLCSNNLTAPSGEVWGSLNFAGHGAASGTETNGLDVVVTNWPSSVFTATALGSLLPSTFPGFPASGGAITTVVENPAQPISGTTIVGNSAVLNFASDITRPASGSKSLYVSYLLSIGEDGQLGSGNDGRFMAFLPAANLKMPNSTYTYWSAFFNVFNGAPQYCGFGLLQDTSILAYIGACDCSTGKDFTGANTGYTIAMGSSPTAAPGAPGFVVGNYVFNASGSDTMTMWLNPATSSFGGATPPSSADVHTMAFNMTDIGGLCLLDRPGNGQSGGVGTNYLANLLVGSTWSYVTGGPEFTTQPAATTIAAPGQTVTLTAVGVAASQSVTYQWQRNSANVQNGLGGAGGAATVSGATSSTLTLTGVSTADAGSYQAVATASGTTYNLASSNAEVIVSDPGVIAQPSPSSAAVNAGQSVSFTATVETTSAKLTYAWYHNSTMLVNGTQADLSTASGAQGTNNGGGTINLTLTLNNVACAEDGSYSLVVTNASGSSVATSASTLSVTDPYISVQPPALTGLASGQATVISVVANGTGLTYQWNWNNGNGANVNNGEIVGTNTAALTITGANTANDAGTYYVVVSGTCGSPVTSANSTVVEATAPTSLSLYPTTAVQQVGTHIALVGNVSGGSGVIQMYLQLNGTNLNAGPQPDGSTMMGPGAIMTGPGTANMILSNLTVADSGTYTVIASNVAGMVSAQSIVTISSGLLYFSTNDLVVTRVGDGAQPLSGATGNTLYLDQYTTNGAYVNSTMVPDSGPNAVVVAGGGVEGGQEGYLTVSSNNQYLNFGGFCYSYPFAGSDVTVGEQETGGSTTNVRGIYALNGQGVLALVYTNYGLYSGGHGFRDAYSTDGLTNFWTTGSAGSGTVKYVNAGPSGASYTITTPGNGIPALSSAASGGVCLGMCGTNLVFTDNSTDGDAGVPDVWGVNQFIGAPMAATTNTTQLLDKGSYSDAESHPTDFAFSPDLQTVYTANDDNSALNGGNGGVQRWDFSSSTGLYEFSYILVDTTGVNTNGLKGLAVVWPANITTWGAGVAGAILYATTSEATNNRIIQIVDPGYQNSSSTLVVASGPNQFFHGIRFAPKTVPLAIPAPPASQNVIVDHSASFNPVVVGNMAYYFPNAAGTAYNQLDASGTTYQWRSNGVAIAGATNISYSIGSVPLSANGSSYTLVVSNRFNGAVTSAPPAVLTVSTFTPTTDLVGWWKLSDGSGTNLADSSGYGDTGFMTNFPGNNSEWVAGLDGADALNFANADGNADNGVLVPDAPQLNFSNNLAFTLAAWIRSSTANQTNGAGLITKGSGNGGEAFDLDLYGTAHRFFVRSSSGGVTAINTTIVPPLNEWEHVVATYDGNAGNMALYINGVLASNLSVPGSLLPTAYPVSIGARTASSTNIWGPTYDFPFQGEMQDVRIYDVALDASDVATVYNVLAPQITGRSHIVTNPAGSFVAAGQFQFNISGSANTTYRVWSTTNVALTPVIGKWTLVTSGAFNAGGSATVTDTAATGVTKYYTITQP